MQANCKRIHNALCMKLDIISNASNTAKVWQDSTIQRIFDRVKFLHPTRYKQSSSRQRSLGQYWTITEHERRTLPFSASLLARMHSTRFSSSLHDMVWMLHGNDSSWTFFEKRLTARARSLNDRLWRTWCTRSASVLYANGLPAHTHTTTMSLVSPALLFSLQSSLTLESAQGWIAQPPPEGGMGRGVWVWQKAPDRHPARTDTHTHTHTHKAKPIHPRYAGCKYWFKYS